MNKIEKQAIVIVISLVILLVGAGLFIFINQQKETKNTFVYNGFKVTKTEDKQTEYYDIELLIGNNPQLFSIDVRNDPREIELIPSENNIKDKILRSNVLELYITMEPTYTSKAVIAAMEISKIVGNKYFFNLPTHGALIRDVGTNSSIKTCEDVNETTSIIWLTLSDSTRIHSRGNCVIIEGKTEDDLIKASDRVSLSLLGIIE